MISRLQKSYSSSGLLFTGDYFDWQRSLFKDYHIVIIFKPDVAR